MCIAISFIIINDFLFYSRVCLLPKQPLQLKQGAMRTGDDSIYFHRIVFVKSFLPRLGSVGTTSEVHPHQRKPCEVTRGMP
jgi:hypothetical protein